jgi:hypothetical protein
MMEMFARNKMPEELKSLYTSEHLDQVVRILTSDEPEGEWDTVTWEIEVAHSN